MSLGLVVLKRLLLFPNSKASIRCRDSHPDMKSSSFNQLPSQPFDLIRSNKKLAQLYGEDWKDTTPLEQLRKNEFARLDKSGATYLDYTSVSARRSHLFFRAPDPFWTSVGLVCIRNVLFRNILNFSRSLCLESELCLDSSDAILAENLISGSPHSMSPS